MSKTITVTCLDTQKKISVDVSKTFFDTVMDTPTDSKENWEAYNEIQCKIMNDCHAQNISFWEAKINGEWWSSEM